MSKFENPNEYYENSDNSKGLIGSLVFHSAIVVLVVASLLLTPEQAAGPIQLELWAEGTEQVLKAPTETATMDPADEDTVNEDEIAPEPEPAPEPEEAPEAEVEEATPEPVVTPPVAQTPPPVQQEDPEIALEKKREEDRLKREEEEKRQQEIARKEEELKKQEADKLRQQELARKEEERKKQEADKKRQQELALKEEQERKAAAEKKRLAELEEKKKADAKAKAAADARLAAETKAKANRQGADVKGALKGDIASIAGIKGGSNTKNQRGGGGGSNATIQAIQRCVQPLLKFGGGQRLTAHYEVTINANLQATNARITRRSGNAAFDNAVVNALKACKNYPAAIRSSKFTGPFTYTR